MKLKIETYFSSDAKSGMYYLMEGSGAEKAYCYMDKLCGEKGWTMILKADGHKVKNIKQKQKQKLFL